MKKSIIPFLLLVFLTNALSGQNGFFKAYGNGTASATAMKRTDDGGYIICGGISNIGAGSLEMYLLKTDSTGNLAWTRTFGGTEYDCGWAVMQDNEGNYIALGATRSFGGPGAYYFIKTDQSGNLLKEKTYGNNNSAYPYCVKQTSDSNYIIYGLGGFPYYSLLVKTNKNGDTLWTRTYTGKIGRSVFETSDAGFLLCGHIANTSKIYVTKTNDTGLPLWTKSIEIDSSLSMIIKMKETNDGGYIIVGENQITPQDVLLIKIDSLANVQWAKSYGGSNTDSGSDVEQTFDGGYIITGFTNSFGISSYGNNYLIKTDSNGNLLWSKTFGDSLKDQGFSIFQTDDRGYIFAGVTHIAGGVSLIKTDSTGRIGCYESTPPTMVNSHSANLSTAVFNSTNGIPVSNPTSVIASFSEEFLFCTYSIFENNNSYNPIDLYPNPANERLTLVTPGSGEIEILNVNGQRLESIITNDKETIVELGDLAPGLYIVKYQSNEGVFVKKFIKQ